MEPGPGDVDFPAPVHDFDFLVDQLDFELHAPAPPPDVEEPESPDLFDILDDLDNAVVVRQPQRGPEAAKRMRKAKAAKKKEAEKEAKRRQEEELHEREDTLALLAPHAAEFVGIKKRRMRKGQAVSKVRAINLGKIAFMYNKVLAAENRFCFKGVVEATLTRIFLERFAQTIALVAGSVNALKRAGYQVLVGWNMEWDEAKLKLKSLTNVLVSNLNSSIELLGVKYKECARNLKNRLYQHVVAANVLQMSGNIKIVAIDSEGGEVSKDWHWVYPPLVLWDHEALVLLDKYLLMRGVRFRGVETQCYMYLYVYAGMCVHGVWWVHTCNVSHTFTLYVQEWPWGG